MSDLNTRVAALESQVAEMRKKLEQAEILASVKRGLDQINRGEGIPAREAIEALRQKYNIPPRNHA